MDARAPNAIDEREAAALAAGSPFAAALAGAALAIADGAPLRAIFATPAALALVGAPDLGSFNAIVFASESPGARRLQRLAETLPPRGAPRLETLRVYVGRLPANLGLAVGRLRNGHIALAPPADLARGPSLPLPPEMPVFVSPPLDGPVRFLWTLDADGRFGEPDSALAARLGPQAPRHGELLSDFGARIGAAAAPWVKAVAAAKTFAALRLEWPEADGYRARVVTLSGAPAFERNRTPLGFRGFGVFTGEGVALAERPEPVELPIAPPDTGEARTPHHEPPIEPTSEPEREPIELAITAEAPPSPDTFEAPAHADLPIEDPPADGAEFVRLRTPGDNVVPIRPGAFQSLFNAPSPDEPEAPREEESVALSSQERDAFREIARQLGARIRPPRPAEPAPEPVAEGPAEAKAPPDPVQPPEAVGGLINILPIGVLVMRHEEALFLNRTLLELLGYPSLAAFQEAKGLAKTFRGRDAAALATPGGMLLVTSDGETLTADAQARLIEWEGATATLISIRRSYEAEHQAQLRALECDIRAHADKARDKALMLEAAADGALRLDVGGRILAMNRSAESLFGWDQGAAAGESFLSLMTPEAHPEVQAAFERVLGEPEGLKQVEALARAHDGRSFPARLTFGELSTLAAREFFVIVDDLTELRTREREGAEVREIAEKATLRKTEFLASVSHEIRTPLHAILGFAEVMMEERFGPIGNERYKEYLKDIHSSGQHMMSLANDLLDLAKVEAGKMELQFAPLDANRIIRESVALMQPQAARERVIMRLSLYDKLPNVMADERSLRQILLNLISNAVKYNEPGGQVIISTAIDDSGHSVIRVRDTGVGMDEAELGHAMEPFRRLSGRRDGGTGLGLPLTRALAEANHADFSIKSRKEQGTLVEVAFPVVKAAQ